MILLLSQHLFGIYIELRDLNHLIWNMNISIPGSSENYWIITNQWWFFNNLRWIKVTLFNKKVFGKMKIDRI